MKSKRGKKRARKTRSQSGGDVTESQQQGPSRLLALPEEIRREIFALLPVQTVSRRNQILGLGMLCHMRVVLSSWPLMTTRSVCRLFAKEYTEEALKNAFIAIDYLAPPLFNEQLQLKHWTDRDWQAREGDNPYTWHCSLVDICARLPPCLAENITRARLDILTFHEDSIENGPYHRQKLLLIQTLPLLKSINTVLHIHNDALSNGSDPDEPCRILEMYDFLQVEATAPSADVAATNFTTSCYSYTFAAPERGWLSSYKTQDFTVEEVVPTVDFNKYITDQDNYDRLALELHRTPLCKGNIRKHTWFDLSEVRYMEDQAQDSYEQVLDGQVAGMSGR